MLALITNDDGIEAPGLKRLIEAIDSLGFGLDIWVVAPATPQSGKSSAITVETPLFVKEHEPYRGAHMFSVNGTPVDCVKLALHTILPARPDMVLSGINHGSNSGNSVIYSGTMGAAIEGCLNGIPSVGFSLTHHSLKANFDECIPYVKLITTHLWHKGLPEGICLNVNVPAQCKPQGIKIVRAARGYWTDEYARYETPHGKPYYWLTGRFVNIEPDCPDTDDYWLQRQYVTAVPVVPQSTSGEPVSTLLKEWDTNMDLR